MQLSNNLIPLINQIRSNGFRQVKYSRPICISNFQDPMQLHSHTSYMIVMWPVNCALIADELFASLAVVNEWRLVVHAVATLVDKYDDCGRMADI
jgi:hypothetical protein